MTVIDSTLTVWAGWVATLNSFSNCCYVKGYQVQSKQQTWIIIIIIIKKLISSRQSIP